MSAILPVPFTPSALLISALSLVESGGNIYAINHDRRGAAHYGVLQIEKRVVDDVNIYQGTKGKKKGIKLRRYRFEEMLKPEPSKEVFALYCEIYLEDDATDRQAAMLLHYGPNGMIRNAASNEAREYWMRVSATMEALRAEEKEFTPIIVATD